MRTGNKKEKYDEYKLQSDKVKIMLRQITEKTLNSKGTLYICAIEKVFDNVQRKSMYKVLNTKETREHNQPTAIYNVENSYQSKHKQRRK